MKQNLVLDYSFTNEGEPTGDLTIYNYDGTGVETDGNTLPAIGALDGQIVLGIFRDSWYYRKVDEDPIGKQFTFDGDTNVIVFASDTAVIQAGENIDIVYMNQVSSFMEPVTLSEAKQHIKIPLDIVSDDLMIQRLITAARKKIENYAGVSIIPRVVELYLQLEKPPYELMFGPVSSIVTVTDNDGQIIDAANYKVRGLKFKSIDFNACNNIYVTFVSPGLADEEWKTYILEQVAWVYENRGDVLSNRVAPGVAAAVESKRRWK